MKRASQVISTTTAVLSLWAALWGCSAKNDSPTLGVCSSNAECLNGQVCSAGKCVVPGAMSSGGSGSTGGSAVNSSGSPATGGVAPGTSGGTAGTATGGLSSGGAAGGGATQPCLTDPNLALDQGWVGCDPTLTTDNPMGLQGSIYMYHDGSTCTSPVKACDATGCCIKGATVVDSTFAKWGCGIGFELNSTGGDTPTKSAYTGTAKCFAIKLTGSSGGNPVRINYTQSDKMDNKVAPFLELKPITAGYEGTVCFNDVTCPTEWMPPPDCTLGGPYDLQIQVVGGNNAGAFDMCLTQLIPLESSTSVATLGQICGIVGENDKEHLTAGPYRIQNNVATADNGKQCITASGSGSGAGFKIDSSTLNTSGNSPVAYPSVAYGWHFGQVTTGTGLPKALSAITSAPSTVAYTPPPGGKYNASYDIWAMPTSAGDNPATPGDGLEVMIWLATGGGPNPIGSNTGQTLSVASHEFEIWSGTNSTWQVVSFRSKDTISGWSNQDLKPFLQKVVDMGKAQNDWNLQSIEFGFEIWNGSAGAAVTSFVQSVK